MRKKDLLIWPLPSVYTKYFLLHKVLDYKSIKNLEIVEV